MKLIKRTISLNVATTTTLTFIDIKQPKMLKSTFLKNAEEKLAIYSHDYTKLFFKIIAKNILR